MKHIVILTGESGNTYYVQVEHIILWRTQNMSGNTTLVLMSNGKELAVLEGMDEIASRVMKARLGS